MQLRGPLLAAIDLSDAADTALREAHAMSNGLGVPLVVAHVLHEAYKTRVLFPHEAGVDPAVQVPLETRARHVVGERIRTILHTPADSVTVEIETGSAHAGILAIAERVGAGLIAVGPGRTALRIARSAGVPVLIARPSPTGGSVLGATDFSDPSLPAVHAAADEARRRGAPLRLIHCLDIDPTAYLAPAGAPGMMPFAPLPPSVYEQFEAEARERLTAARAAISAEADLMVLRQPPALGIVESAESVATTLVVVGTRGRTGIARLALGSVAEDVMAYAPCSVLVVPIHPA